MPKGTCSIEGCESSVVACGLCSSHYRKSKRYGDPLVGESRPQDTPANRFWAKVNRDGPVPEHRPDLGPCWVWTAALARGYGKLGAGPRTAGKVHAHRFAYELLVGPIPDGFDLDHLCHNGSGCSGGDSCPHRACVNPTHLEPVSRGENLRRGETVTARHAQVTHCPQGHPYSTASRPGQKRQCPICGREQKRQKTAERKATQ